LCSTPMQDSDLHTWKLAGSIFSVQHRSQGVQGSAVHAVRSCLHNSDNAFPMSRHCMYWNVKALHVLEYQIACTEMLRLYVYC
jgi:hypothetical protein